MFIIEKGKQTKSLKNVVVNSSYYLLNTMVSTWADIFTSIMI